MLFNYIFFVHPSDQILHNLTHDHPNDCPILQMRKEMEPPDQSHWRRGWDWGSQTFSSTFLQQAGGSPQTLPS